MKSREGERRVGHSPKLMKNINSINSSIPISTMPSRRQWNGIFNLLKEITAT